MKSVCIFLLAILLTACGGSPDWEGEWGYVSNDGSLPDSAFLIKPGQPDSPFEGQFGFKFGEDLCRFPDDGSDTVKPICMFNTNTEFVLTLKGDEMTLSEESGDSSSLVRMD